MKTLLKLVIFIGLSSGLTGCAMSSVMLGAMGKSLSNGANRQVQNQPVNCTSQKLGNQVYTNCQ